jgi:hypothetical protein
MRLKRRDDGPVDGVSFVAGISADAVFAASGSSGGVDAADDSESGIGIPTMITDLGWEGSRLPLTHPALHSLSSDAWRLAAQVSVAAGIPGGEVSVAFGSAGCDLAWLTPSRRSLLAVMVKPCPSRNQDSNEKSRDPHRETRLNRRGVIVQAVNRRSHIGRSSRASAKPPWHSRPVGRPSFRRTVPDAEGIVPANADAVEYKIWSKIWCRQPPSPVAVEIHGATAG